MKGFPNTIQTGQDLNNCLALVKQGDIPASKLKEELGRIERLQYIYAPVSSISGDKVTIRYCNEVEIGMTIEGVSVTAIEVIKDDKEQPAETVITFAKQLSADTIILRIPNRVNIYEEMGITQKQINDAMEVLSHE